MSLRVTQAKFWAVLISILLTGCSGQDVERTDQQPVTGRLQRIGSVEKFIQFDAPNRSDVVFVFDTSPSMRVLWSEQAIKQGMRAWFDTMRTTAENVPDKFDYFIHGSTPNADPNVSDADAIIGGNGDLFFTGSTHSPEHGKFFMEGLDMISGFVYRPHVAIYDALVAIMGKIEHHRRTVGMDVVYFGDTDPDKSTKTAEDVVQAIKQVRKDQTVNIHIFIKSPQPGVSYCSTPEILQEVETNYANSAAAKLAQLQSSFKVNAYAVDRVGTYGCEGQSFENVFEKFGAQTNRPKDMFALGTDIVEGIVKTEINGVEVPVDAYQLQVDSREGIIGQDYFIKFVNGPPPAGSTVTVYYR